MHKLIVLLYFFLSLAGCDHPGRTIVMRSSTDGIDLLYSRVTVFGSTSTFECIQSRSGRCHYGVFEHDCTSMPGCKAPSQQFALDVDRKQRLIDLPADFELCVSADAGAMSSDCLRPGAKVGEALASTSNRR
ncbi:MAG: hypothetical protein ABI870_15910 [Rhodanobacter sp.]